MTVPEKPQKSTYKVEVVPVTLESHPDADSLSVVRIFAGYTCCVRTADWKGKTTGAYIPPDRVVDSSRPEFAFLAGHERIKVKKLRGIVSMGLLIPAPPGANIGDDVADYFGVIHYEPKLPMSTGGEVEPLREGLVVKPQTERIHPEVGRVCLKIVSNSYLERA